MIGVVPAFYVLGVVAFNHFYVCGGGWYGKDVNFQHTYCADGGGVGRPLQPSALLGLGVSDALQRDTAHHGNLCRHGHALESNWLLAINLLSHCLIAALCHPRDPRRHYCHCLSHFPTVRCSPILTDGGNRLSGAVAIAIVLQTFDLCTQFDLPNFYTSLTFPMVLFLKD